MPSMLLVVPVLYLALLVGVLFLHGVTKSFMILGLPIPTVVIWFGTLGGVIDSLQGIFANNRKWKHSFTFWHIYSGILGAVYGLTSYLFLTAIVNAGGGTKQPAQVLFALAAFTIGYEQSKFHSMMDQIFGIIFQQNKSPDDAPKNERSSGGSPNLIVE
jgi:hypothetical protein